MSVGMSIVDYTTGLFREAANLRAFVDDPQQALRDAGLPDATPEQVHDLMPLVAESMPPEHPLQAVVHAEDPVSALQALDVDDLIAGTHDHHREVADVKALGGAEVVSSSAPVVVCTPDAAPEADSGGEKELGEAIRFPDDPMTPEIEEPSVPVYDYPGEQQADVLDEPDLSSVVWGKGIE